MTAMNPHSVTDDESVTLPKELVLPEKMTEQATLEREYIKPPARSRALRRFPVLAVYGAACFSLALISPYIPHLSSMECVYGISNTVGFLVGTALIEEQEGVSVLLGFIIMALAFLFVGPAPFLQIPPYLWLVYLTQAAIGFGCAAVIVGSFSLALKKAIERGFPNSMWTYATVCGFLFGAITLGSSVAPLLSRYATDNIRYENASLVMLAALVICVIMNFGACIKNSKRKRTILRETTEDGAYNRRDDP
ncbi:hypothetical protein HPB50_016860 [Hyalomma asiaticum]|uniref:Uncharacterized protein n=1 Tax=Hyalomma asiaticum TaxID=266040 RepID=A0ACB7S1B5_HYAAI|nr:hypothetical protein HPB50_016860 [Hyalomma asiaticum]